MQEIRLSADKNEKISTNLWPLDPVATPMVDEKGQKNDKRPALSIPLSLKIVDLIEYAWDKGANIK